MTFAKRLADMRKKRGLGKATLARKAKISRQLIQQYESGDIPSPGAEAALKLAAALDVSAYWLVLGGGSMAPRIAMTDEEREVVLTYRGLTPAFQETLRNTARGLLTASRGATVLNPYPGAQNPKK